MQGFFHVVSGLVSLGVHRRLNGMRTLSIQTGLMLGLLALALCALIAAIAYALRSPSRPLLAVNSSAILLPDHPQVDLPPVRDLAHYVGAPRDQWHALNPFVPWAEQRLVHQSQRSESSATTDTRSTDTRSTHARSTDGLDDDDVLDAPDLVEVPALTAPAASPKQPRVQGVMQRGMHAQAYVQHQHELRRVRVGDAHGVWTVHAINGRGVEWRNEHGESLFLPVQK